MDITDISGKLTTALRGYKNILIFIKGSPDPDVIASSFALKCICDSINVRSTLFALAEISLPQNQAIVRDLKIPLHIEKALPDLRNYDAYAILDHQSAYVKDLSERLPCAVHIDHHEKIDSPLKIDFEISTGNVGAVSTIMALVLKELNIPVSETTRKQAATALLYGIQTDTDNYHHAGRADFEAVQFLTTLADAEIIARVSDFPLSETAVRLIGKAAAERELYKDWLISGIGFIDESNRDIIAIIADFLLQKTAASTVIVFAVVEKSGKRGMGLDASFRTKNENLDLNDVIKRITAEGGARKFKGAYQVNLDYFRGCPDRELLWQVVSLTTLQVLKRARDGIRLMELRSFYERFKKRIDTIFKQ